MTETVKPETIWTTNDPTGMMIATYREAYELAEKKGTVADCHEVAMFAVWLLFQNRRAPVSAEANVPTLTNEMHSTRAFKLPSGKYMASHGDAFPNLPHATHNAVLVLCAEGQSPDALMRRLSQSPSATRDGGWWPAFDAAQRVPVAASAESAPQGLGEAIRQVRARQKSKEEDGNLEAANECGNILHLLERING